MLNASATDGWLNQTPKAIESLVYARTVSGSDFNIEVDRKVLATQLGLLRSDGLTYAPQDSLPALTGPGCFSEVWAEGRWLQTLSVLMQVDGDSRWEEIAKKKIDRLLSLTRTKEDFRFFGEAQFHPGSAAPADESEPFPPVYESPLVHDENDPAWHPDYCGGAVVLGAARFYRLTRYPPAFELCTGLAGSLLARVYTKPDGRYFVNHFYHGVYPLIALAEYAKVAEDAETFGRVDACYRWVRDMGDRLVGFYSAYMPGGSSYESRRRGNSAFGSPTGWTSER